MLDQYFLASLKSAIKPSLINHELLLTLTMFNKLGITNSPEISFEPKLSNATNFSILYECVVSFSLKLEVHVLHTKFQHLRMDDHFVSLGNQGKFYTFHSKLVGEVV